MRKFSLSAFFIGIGLGMIFSFLFLTNHVQKLNNHIEIDKIPDELIIKRAREIGMIDPSKGLDKEAIDSGKNDIYSSPGE